MVWVACQDLLGMGLISSIPDLLEIGVCLASRASLRTESMLEGVKEVVLLIVKLEISMWIALPEDDLHRPWSSKPRIVAACGI